jgi:iron complex transport system ATP-binding protein
MPADEHPDDPVLDLESVSVVRDGRTLLDAVDWTIRPGERWVLLGRNGSGKTTLVRVASLYLHPTAGAVHVLGETLGRVDVRRLRTRIGVASQSFADLLRRDLTVLDVVVTGKHAALEPWWHTYTEADRARARELIERLGVASHEAQPFGTLSSGERQRVQLARTLMGEPGLLLLDEPAAGLDLAGREDLVHRLGVLAAAATVAPTVLVTHHTEEIPDAFTHALLLRDGKVLVAGPLAEVLTEANLSACFDLPLRLERREGRWLSWAAR